MSTTATFAIIVTIAILGAATMVSIYDLTPAYSVKKSRYCYDIGFEGVYSVLIQTEIAKRVKL